MTTKGARRGKGSGSLYQRCEKRCGCPPLVDGPPHPRTGKPTKVRPAHKCQGMWVAVVELQGLDGQRVRKPIVRARKADAQRELQKALVQRDRVGDLSGTTPTLNAWVEEWWEKYAPDNIKVTQWHKYRTYLALYILPVLGKKRLDQIDVSAIEQMQRHITSPKPKGLGLKASTAVGAQRMLSSILSYAVVREKVHRNVALIAKPAKVGRKIKEPQLDLDEALRVLDVHDPGNGSVPQILAMLSVAFYVGLRPSELIGLTRDSIDLDAGEMEISWQLQRIIGVHGCGPRSAEGTWPCGKVKAGYCPKKVVDIPDHTDVLHVEGSLWLVRPKTDTSWRRFPMPPQLVALLRIFLADLEPGIQGLIFHRPRGGKGKGAALGRPISLEEWNRRWHQALRDSGLAPDDHPTWRGSMPTPHSARKTCNTILRDLGVPTDVRILILGHAAAEVNEKVYTSTSDKRAHEAMQSMGAAMTRRALTAS